MNTSDRLEELVALVRRLAARHDPQTPICVSSIGGDGHYLTLMTGDDPDEYATYSLETGRRLDREEDDA